MNLWAIQSLIITGNNNTYTIIKHVSSEFPRFPVDANVSVDVYQSHFIKVYNTLDFT